MRSGDRRNVRLETAGMVPMTYLGKGHYATAYCNDIGTETFPADGMVHLFVSGCYMKEAIKGMGQPHVPAIERLWDEEAEGSDVAIYRMPYYAPLTAKHKDAWKHYRILQKAMGEAFLLWLNKSRTDKYGTPHYEMGYQMSQTLIETVTPLLPESLVEALRDMSDNAASYGSSITFEFSPRNLGVDEEGRLVLRDVLFDMEKIHRELAEKRKKADACRYNYRAI